MVARRAIQVNIIHETLILPQHYLDAAQAVSQASTTIPPLLHEAKE